MVLFVYNHGSFVYSRSVMNQLFTFLHRGSFTFFSYYSLYSSFVYTFRDICRRIIRTSLTNTSIIEYFYIRSRREKANRKFWLKIINEAMDFFYIERGKRTLRSFTFIIFKRNFCAYRLLISSRIVLRMNTLQASKSEFLARTNPPYFLDELIFFRPIHR